MSAGGPWRVTHAGGRAVCRASSSLPWQLTQARAASLEWGHVFVLDIAGAGVEVRRGEIVAVHGTPAWLDQARTVLANLDPHTVQGAHL